MDYSSVSLGWVPRNGIARSHSNRVFSPLRNDQVFIRCMFSSGPYPSCEHLYTCSVLSLSFLLPPTLLGDDGVSKEGRLAVAVLRPCHSVRSLHKCSLSVYHNPGHLGAGMSQWVNDMCLSGASIPSEWATKQCKVRTNKGKCEVLGGSESSEVILMVLPPYL